MARQTINIGTTANDGTGDPLRTAFDKINDNFAELYGADGDSNTLAGNLDTNGYRIVTSTSNQPIYLDPNGSGTIELVGGTNVTGALAVSSTLGVTGNSTLSGTLGVTGLSTLQSLTLASGATVTAVLDDDTMATASATTLATSESVKAYVDSQVTAQDLDFACDDSTVLSIDLDSEQLQFSGGTGITTAGTGNTVTVSIDGTVVTLSGSQTLTNKTLTSPTINGATMTGSVSIDNITINDTDITTSSNANLVLNPGGTGTIELQANSNVAGNATVSGTLGVTGTTTVDGLITGNITTTGNQTITGSLTVNGSGLNVDGININDTTISSDSNANISISPGGSGTIELTTTTNVAGTVTVTGQLDVDNIRVDSNTISSTSGSINITPAAGQNTVLGGIAVASELQATLAEITTVRTDKIQNDTSNGDIQIDTQGTGVVDFRTATQTTVGAGAGANALPGDPVGYLKIKIGGSNFVIPYWNAS